MSAVNTIKNALFGNPPTPGYQPDRQGVVDAFSQLSDLVSLTQFGIVTYPTLSALNAYVPTSTNPVGAEVAFVNNDGSNNNVYTFRNGAWSIYAEFYSGVSTVVQPILNQIQILHDQVLAAASLLPTQFLNGALDPTLPGPYDAYQQAVSVVASDTVFTGLGFPRAISGDNIDQYITIDPVKMVPVGQYVAIAVLVAVSDSANWATFETQTKITAQYLGGNASNQQLIALGGYTSIDATHRVYTVIFQNPFNTFMTKIQFRPALSGKSIGLQYAALSIAVSAKLPIGVEWHVPDPFGVGALAASVASGSSGAIVVAGDSLAVDLSLHLAAYTSRSVTTIAVAGQTSSQSVARLLGGTMQIANDQIVSGNNTVSAINGIPIANTLDANGNQQTAQGGGVQHRILQGVPTSQGYACVVGTTRGQLYPTSSTDNSQPYNFVPDSGQALPVKFPANSNFHPILPKNPTVVIRMGRNNFTTAIGTAQQGYGAPQVVSDCILADRAFTRILICSIPNGDPNGTVPGSSPLPNEGYPNGSYYLNLIALNGMLQSALGPHFFDIDRMKKDLGLITLNLTPNSNDATDRSSDVISNQLRRDALHGGGGPNNDNGETLDAIYTTARLTADGI